MYHKFYGLSENPFNVNPDPRYLYVTEHIQEALACLRYGIENRKGFILLTGEVGTGKTTLLNKLLETLRQKGIASAFIFNSRLNTVQFFDFMLADFGLPTEPRVKSQMLMRLNQWLLERYQAGGTTVLIVDEAQNLSLELLEEIRLLTNLETSSEKLLQIVLAGQPEFEQKLSQPQVRQLRQRITLRGKTFPLAEDELPKYLAQRLHVAGWDGRSIFSPRAVEVIQKYSCGIPRVINLLCEHALISGYASQQRNIGPELIMELVKEFELDVIGPVATPARTSAQEIKAREQSASEAGLLMRKLRRSH
ncbi:MAG: AAA family ATPase [Acidobacteria bacterium]|nr:AAA family ATPase [Acidobacteriota bacterium]